MNKRKQITKYFTTDSPKRWQFVLAGFVAMIGLSRISESFGLGLFFLIPAIITGSYLYYWKRIYDSLPSGSKLDSWLEEDIQAILESRPYDKLGISKDDLVAESMLVVGPIYWFTNGFDQKDIMAKEGKDGFNRYSVWKVQFFMFTEDYLCSYKCDYNWLKNTYINESTNEFFYKDVVSVKTDTISSAHTLINGKQLVHSEAFQLKLMGDEVTVITNDARLKTSADMTSKAEKAVQSIRVMLRDKKKTTVAG